MYAYVNNICHKSVLKQNASINFLLCDPSRISPHYEGNKARPFFFVFFFHLEHSLHAVNAAGNTGMLQAGRWLSTNPACFLPSQLWRTERKKGGNQPVMNDGSAVNEKSTGKHKALNAQPYWLLTGANNISIALTETNHTFPPATTQVLDRNKSYPLIKQ